jgi:long-subunit acyl-CoA synthetase (AMP-forming)
METHLHYFYKWEKEKPEAVFLRQPFGDSWKEITYGEAGREARKMAAALFKKGFKKGDHVGIFSKNCYHWILADLAIMMAGGISVPFYPTVSGEELEELLQKGDCKFLFVGKLDIFNAKHAETAAKVISIKFPHYQGNATINVGDDWNELISNSEPLTEVHSPKRNDLWTILFTSGTTGSPKGVMLTFNAPVSIMEIEEKYGGIGIFNLKEFRFISYLPLNHIAERMIVEAACFLTGGTISFAESIDTFAKNLASIQPTIFMSVPRIFTKFQLAILEKLGGPKRFKLLMSIPGISSILKKKIKQGIGLAKAEVILTGAAPTPDSVKEWYKILGITLREVYGMTENSGGCTLMPPDYIKPGTVGKPLHGVEIKIDPETDEVLMRAPWLMKGYYKDDEKTAAVIQDGWLRTGDRGELDSEGFLKLTGRVSDTFKTAKGKFIVPAPMEWMLAKNNNIEQVCVVGLAAPQPLALVSLSELGKQIDKEKLHESLKYSLESLNNTLPSYQKVSKVVVIKDEWTTDSGILTPTLKIKRNIVDKRYSQYYESWSQRTELVIEH